MLQKPILSNKNEVTEYPKITVLMPVYNGARYLNQSIQSILDQTFKDFELLIIDDGSADNSLDIINSIQDKRIRTIENGKNNGQIKALNLGIKLAKGDYIARMDCDDICMPLRLERQYQYMEENIDVGLIGTWIKTFGEESGAIFKYPTNSNELRCGLLFDCQLGHPTIMFRKQLFVEYGLKYDQSAKYIEDWELWQRCSGCFELSNLAEILLKYRVTKQSASRSNKIEQKINIKNLHKKNLQKLVSDLTDKELEIHCNIGAWEFGDNQEFSRNAKNWLEKLYYSNQSKMLYPEPEFTQILSERWCSICNYGRKCGLMRWIKYEGSFLARLHKKRYRRSAGLLLRSVGLRRS